MKPTKAKITDPAVPLRDRWGHFPSVRSRQECFDFVAHALKVGSPSVGGGFGGGFDPMFGPSGFDGGFGGGYGMDGGFGGGYGGGFDSGFNPAGGGLSPAIGQLVGGEMKAAGDVVGGVIKGVEDVAGGLGKAVEGWQGFMVRDGDRLRPEACQSPVWDTGLAVLALRACGMSPDHPQLRAAGDYLLGQEVTIRGDWAIRSRAASNRKDSADAVT